MLGIWHICESVEDLLEIVHMSGREFHRYQALKNELRKKQWLAWRALLAEMIQGESILIDYNAHGKPLPVHPSFSLSVTHSGPYACCLWGKAHSLGIDIEQIKPRILKIAPRFLSEEEFHSFSLQWEPRMLTLLWAAKEAVYKYQGREGFDFRNQIALKPFPLEESGKIEACLQEGNKTVSLSLSYEFPDPEYALVYTS